MTTKFRWETEFKETEIGEIPKDWEVKKLKDLVKFVKGVSYTSSEINSEGKGTMFITLNNFLRGGGFKKDEFKYYTGNKAKEEHTIKNGDIIIAMTDMTPQARVVGAPAVISLPENYNYGIISLDCAKAISMSKVSNYYLYLYLIVSQEENATFANGVNVLHLNLKLFVEHKLIPYPSLPEQTRIATVLSWFDDLIENKKRQNEILEKTAMAIFKNWFIDFEPFKDGEFVDSEIGKIPKGWEIGRLREVCKIIMGQSPESKYYNFNGEGLPFIQGVGQFGKITPETDTFCSKILKMAKRNDILITVRAPIAELNFADNEYIIGRGVCALRGHYYSFVYLYLLTYGESLKALERGTTFDAITKDELENFQMVLPPSPILQKFHSLVEPLFQKIIINQKQIMLLRKVRDKLLPLLVFGKLRLEEV